MKLKICLLLIAIFLHCGSFKNLKRNNPKKFFIARLARQLSKVKGIKSCNLYVDKNLKSSQVIDMLQLQLTKMFPIMTMGRKTLPVDKYRRTKFVQMIHWRKREQKGILNCASASSILIAVVGPIKPNIFWQYFCRVVYRNLVPPMSIPKFLVISITNKKYRAYKGVFDFFQVMDVEVLEIAVPNRKVKGFLFKRNFVDFTVHKCNSFLNFYKKLKLKRDVKWFESKFRNLHGSKLKIATPSSNCSVSVAKSDGKRIYECYTDGPKSSLGTHLITSMNVTFTEVRSHYKLKLERNILTGALFFKNEWLKPVEIWKYQLYTPTIFDDQLTLEIDYFFLFFFTATVFTLLLLQICQVVGNFDRLTWSSYEVVKMLLGFANPRRPIFPVESALFCLISLSGICVVNIFTQTFTDMLLSIAKERVFDNYSDLEASNVTLYLREEPAARDERIGIVYDNPIISSNVTYIVWSKFGTIYFMTEMLVWKNISVSVLVYNKFDPLGTKIAIDGKLLARRSDIAEISYVASYWIQPFSPYYERISDLYWRFGECGFSAHSAAWVRNQRLNNEEEIERQYWENQISHESEDSQLCDYYVTSIVLICFLFVGLTATVVAFFIEATYFMLNE